MADNRRGEQRETIAAAVEERDWGAVRYRALLQVADAMDNTTSARDVKSLSLSLMQLLGELEVRPEDCGDTPLARIMAEADRLAGETGA